MPAVEVRSSDRILLKALNLFSSKGYDATSVREICEAAEITKPTLYHFYGSKEGVYRALVEGALDRFRQDVMGALGGGGSTPDRLKGVARSYFASTRTQRELVRFMFSLVHSRPSSAPETDFPRFYEEIVRMVASAVDDGVARGELRAGPTEIRMLAFMGALGEAVCGFILTGRPELTDGLADALVDTLLQGWVS
jgi:TetR/AcrR family transcriptional regulator